MDVAANRAHHKKARPDFNTSDEKSFHNPSGGYPHDAKSCGSFGFLVLSVESPGGLETEARKPKTEARSGSGISCPPSCRMNPAFRSHCDRELWDARAVASCNNPAQNPCLISRHEARTFAALQSGTYHPERCCLLDVPRQQGGVCAD